MGVVVGGTGITGGSTGLVGGLADAEGRVPGVAFVVFVAELAGGISGDATVVTEGSFGCCGGCATIPKAYSTGRRSIRNTGGP